MSKLIDQLLSDGLEIGDFVVKAQLKVPVRSAHLPVAQDIIDDAMSLVDEHYAAMFKDIEDVLSTADARKSLGLYVVDGGLSGNDLFKAQVGQKPPKQPATNISGQPRAKPGQGGNYQRKEMDTSRAGSRGGKWYLDGKGHIRYGTKPTHVDARELETHEVATHLAHFRPSAFMGTHGADKDRPQSKRLSLPAIY